MFTLNTVPYQPWHAFELRKLYPRALDMGRAPDEYAKGLHHPHLAWTMVRGDQPLAIGGVLPLWEGVGEAWAIVTLGAQRHPMAFHRAAKRRLYEMQAHGKFHRIQCVVEWNHTVGHRWAESLGFMYEGPHYLYCERKLNYKRYCLLANY